MLASRRFQMVLLGMLIPTAVYAQIGSTAARVPKSIPFTMSQTETRVQTLPDNSTIIHVTIIRTLHDSEGRTRTERVFSGGMQSVRSEGGKTYMRRRPDTVQVTVNDPIAGTSLSWVDNNPGQNKLVTVTHTKRYPSMPYTPMTQAAVNALSGPEAISEHEDLGIKQIQGIYVRGNRSTTSFPAGFDGNAAAYSTSSEYWRSDDLGGLMVEQMNESMGTKSTTTLDSYTPGDPDAGVFQAPYGYTVWDLDAPVTSQ